MTHKEIFDLVWSYPRRQFRVTYCDGRKALLRLFISTGGMVCEFYPRSRSCGRPINTSEIASISRVIRKNDTGIGLCRSNLKRVVQYLSNSGFWTPMLECAKHFLTMTDEELKAMTSYDQYRDTMKMLNEQGMDWWGVDCFCNLFSKRIRTMNFHQYEKESLLEQIRKAMTEKTGYRYNWRKGYDNSLELVFKGDYGRAWYAEEFKDCGNGHYYFLLDENHIIFGEDD